MKKVDIKYKYLIDEVVFYKSAKSIPTFIACDMCAGVGAMFRKDGSEIKCPKCNGKTTISTHSGSIVEVAVKAYVDSVNITINSENKCSISYSLRENRDAEDEDTRLSTLYGKSFHESQLFESPEEVAKTFTKCCTGYGTT